MRGALTGDSRDTCGNSVSSGVLPFTGAIFVKHIVPTKKRLDGQTRMCTSRRLNHLMIDWDIDKFELTINVKLIQWVLAHDMHRPSRSFHHPSKRYSNEISFAQCERLTNRYFVHGEFIVSIYDILSWFFEHSLFLKGSHFGYNFWLGLLKPCRQMCC